MAPRLRRVTCRLTDAVLTTGATLMEAARAGCDWRGAPSPRQLLQRLRVAAYPCWGCPAWRSPVAGTLAGSEPVGISIRCIASPIRGLPFKYEPQDRRFNGGIGRRHRWTVGAAGHLGVHPETGVVRRLKSLARATRELF